MSASLFWVGLFAQIVLMISAASLPSCQLSDSECLKLTAQSAMPMLIAGIPDISAENLDPLHLDKVKVELAGLKLSVKGADIKGLSKSTIDKVKVNLKKKILQVVYHCDVQMMGKYKASGKLLILPISGDGDMLLKLKNMEVKLSMPFEFIMNSDGNDVMDLKSFSLIYDVKDGAQFGLTNLFDGNKELSDSMLKFMNENWKVLTEEFGLPILEAGHKVVFDSIKKFLATQPIQNTA